jgi:diguanylate cyclase (GGDEF)-like protein
VIGFPDRLRTAVARLRSVLFACHLWSLFRFGCDPAQAAGSTVSPTSSQMRSLGVLSMDRRECSSKGVLEEELFSALLVGNNDLGHILQQVDEISHTLKSDAPESEKLSNALQLTVSCAVRQTLLERELRSLALTDDLTGLYNRRGFLVSATQQLKLALRNTQELLLFFCDVDNLKEINDSYGHGEGDLALIRTAEALEQTFRDSDILARLAGDEFAVLALEASSQAQEVILDRLETNLEKSRAGESRYELSLSVGVGRFDSRRPVSLGELMAQADQAMYEQKRKRARFLRNQARGR